VNQTSTVLFGENRPMRTARVLDMLLLLQRRGRLTARSLAEMLEVSERTILRDVEGLSEAGVPIFAVRGAGGGIELLDGFETHLTGLTTDEALCLFLVGQPQVAHRLGLAAPTRSVRNKLLNALPSALATEADRLATWFVHDPDPWSSNLIPHGELRRLARSIQRHRKIELTITNEPTMTVLPLGLVLKAGSWHLIVAGDVTIEVVCIDQLRATRLTSQTFTPPADVDLADFWKAHALEAGAIVPGRVRDHGHLRSELRPRAN
jgi:predicted DNA-binding transcriptional regulator YafY